MGVLKTSNPVIYCPACGFNKVRNLPGDETGEQYLCDDCGEIYNPFNPNQFRVLAPNKEQRIRKGDRVKVIKPEKFVRCGYPLTLAEAEAKVQELFSEQINVLYQKICDIEGTKSIYQILAVPEPWKLTKAAAEIYLEKVRYGGPKRTIHTEKDESLRGVESVVSDIRYVVTGYYNTGGYDPEFGADPAYLSLSKRHAILTIGGIFNSFGSRFLPSLDIQAINCQKLNA